MSTNINNNNTNNNPNQSGGQSLTNIVSIGINIGAQNTIYSSFSKVEKYFISQVLLMMFLQEQFLQLLFIQMIIDYMVKLLKQV